jgi:hypothetical protein
MPDFEKLGVFYMGRAFDLSKKKRLDDLLLYDSRDLVTHAVCVGMTGSGKTGLCLSLIEEAAIDGVPAILIDPKGDLCNLLLTFPDLSPSDFRPWINEDDASRKGMSPDEYAKQQAELWKNGLAEWGEDGERIRKLRESADFAIYTPGSSAGLPVSILKSFAAPPQAARDDEEVLRERVSSTATGLLTLAGVDADPLKSREHILVSTILAAAWQKGEDLDLASLISRIQTPPVSKIGVVDLESFFPAKERFALAMGLNNLLAAPGFASWLEGEPLEVGSLLRTASGKPRIAIFSIAHLSDAERMFFVTLLLNQTLAWMRAQSGTTSLRAILYMDEIAGYFPPVAAPPAKAPLLTLLKQGRAFGLGVVLATQNPVDLDYKGLSNTGTWFPRTPPDRAGQGARARRARRGGRERIACVRSGEDGADARRPRQPRVPAAERARGRPGHVRDALGAVVSARASHAGADQDAHGSRAGEDGGGRAPDGRRARVERRRGRREAGSASRGVAGLRPGARIRRRSRLPRGRARRGGGLLPGREERRVGDRQGRTHRAPRVIARLERRRRAGFPGRRPRD